VRYCIVAMETSFMLLWTQRFLVDYTSLCVNMLGEIKKINDQET